MGFQRRCCGGGTLLEVTRWRKERREKGRSIMDGVDDYNRNVLFVIVTIYSYMCMMCFKSVTCVKGKFAGT